MNKTNRNGRANNFDNYIAVTYCYSSNIEWLRNFVLPFSIIL